jgi:DNA helicase-2/ATP-dependent DNA helicase PcrA
VRDEAEQVQFVVDRLLAHHEEGMPLREIAVLFRAGYLSAALEIELANRRIPYEKWGGLKFLEAAHIKDVLAFLRVLENPRDEVSWFRLLRLLPGVGDVTARAAIDALQARGWDPRALGTVAWSRTAAPGARALSALLDGMQGVEGTPEQARTRHGPAESIRLVRQLYDPLLKEAFDDAPARLADLDQLEIIAAGYPDRATFLAALALEPPANTQDLAVGAAGEDDALILSTVHSAKGREWDAVFVIHASDGVFPMARAAGDEEQVEEERRLLYVAMTRARDHLYLSWPMQAYATRTGADFSYQQLSRFLDPGVREALEQVTLGTAPAPLLPQAPDTPPLDLRALLRGRFTS